MEETTETITETRDTTNEQRGAVLKEAPYRLFETLIAFITMILPVGAAMGLIVGVRSLDPTLIQQVTMSAGEETDPSAGRLAGLILFFVWFIVLERVAEKQMQKKPDRLMLPWILASASGTLLWISLGECAWHFGLPIVTEERAKGFATFPRIESVHGLPFFILLTLILIVMFRQMTFAGQACMLAFMGNWYGHLCMIGFYPIALAMGTEMAMEPWYKMSAIINTIIFAILGAVVSIRGEKKETRYLASILFYVAIGALVFGAILGET